MYYLTAYSTNLKIILQYAFFLTLHHLRYLKNHVESRPLLMPVTPPTTGHTQRPVSEHSFEGYRKLPGDKRRNKVSQDLKREGFVSAATALGIWTSSSLTCHREHEQGKEDGLLNGEKQGCWRHRNWVTRMSAAKQWGRHDSSWTEHPTQTGSGDVTVW